MKFALILLCNCFVLAVSAQITHSDTTTERTQVITSASSQARLLSDEEFSTLKTSDMQVIETAADQAADVTVINIVAAVKPVSEYKLGFEKKINSVPVGETLNTSQPVINNIKAVARPIPQ